MIPDVDRETGNLPTGIHPANWDDFVARFGSNPRRMRLIDGLRRGLELLALCGCERAYIDGSFVTAKEFPGDFDVCWNITGINEEALDPIFLDFSDSRSAQKARFGGEFFPAEFPADPAGTTFLEFFQLDRAGRRKGIVLLTLGDLK